ncbi:MAG: murein biosynthesis integral membrane protein MurJ [Candidatus Omnitrophota bacterium]
MSTGNSHPLHSHKAITKSAGIIGFATLISRILGFIRDIVIARLFGVYVYAQAFVVAFKIPNLFRDLLGEGAANAAFVPVFTEYRVKHTEKEFWELANVVLNLLLVILTSITLLGIIFSPVLVRLIAPGFAADPAKLQATITLNRIIFPYLLLICLAAYSMGLLNSLKHFAIPAFAPCLLNISIIAFALIFGEGITGLAAGVLVGGVLQLAVQIPVLYKKGFRLNLFKKFDHSGARTIGRLMLPRLASSSIYQLNNFVDTIFGSLAFVVGDGGVAVLYFAYRLIQFPLGVFSTALSQAILPTFSQQALEPGHDDLKRTLSFGLRATFFVLLPSSVVFFVLSRPLIQVLFGGGRFDAYSISNTASALKFYSLGLVAYGLTKILQSCFFALKDTYTPTKIAFIALVMNVVLNAVLMFPMKIAGLALATSISGIVTAVILFASLYKRLMPYDLKDVLVSFLRVFLSSICMGAACYLVCRNYEFSNAGIVFNIISLTAILVIAAFIFIIFCFIFRVSEIKELWIWLTKRKVT